jgi:hypothetical protein
VEIKAAATFTPEMLKGLENFSVLHGDLSGASLVYSGPPHAPVRGVSIVNHSEVANMLFGAEDAGALNPGLPGAE